MGLSLFLQGLGSVGVFATRAFLPAFATAMALRFGPEVGWVARLGLFPQVRDVPTWFTQDITLVVLGLLSALELAAERVPEAREAFAGFVHSLRSVMAIVTYLGVLKATDRAVIDPLIQRAGPVEAVPAVLVGAATFIASNARAAVADWFASIDDDDAFGLRRVARWASDAWSLLGPFSLLIFPILTLALLGVATGVMGWLWRRSRDRADEAKVSCVGCGSPVLACAMACPRCGTAVAAPAVVGWLGATVDRPVRDRARQPFRLFAVGRCPTCGTRLGRRPSCPDCGRDAIDDPAFVRDYLAFLDRRVPVACLVCLGLGLVPVLGAVAGVIVYRVMLVGPLRRSLPIGRGLATRWSVRLACLGLVAFQWVPLLGALTLPAMALINYGFYRRAFVRSSGIEGPATS